MYIVVMKVAVCHRRMRRRDSRMIRRGRVSGRWKRDGSSERLHERLEGEEAGELA
jgi:hypothetical protein